MSVSESFSDYTAAIRYLDAYIPTPGQKFEPDLALARTQALMARLGDPQDAVPVIHLAGTSGKGSTAGILAAILQAHGLRVGLGTSPHVRMLRERISIDAAPIDEATFCRRLAEIAPAVADLTRSAWGAPTFFEILIALSYHHFAQTPVDVAVMETGLGGRHDATNTVTRPDKLAVLTPIGFDHTEFLGTTLTAIATAKSGIIHPGNQVLSAAQAPAAAAVIAATCREKGVPLTVFQPATMLTRLRLTHAGVTFDLHWGEDGPTLRNLWLPVPGIHQAANSGLATLAAQRHLAAIGRALAPEAVAQGMAQVVLPGRMERHIWRGRTIIIDGAHNPQKMDAFCATLEALYPGARFPVVVALKHDKAADAILQRLRPLTLRLVCTRFTNTDQGMPLRAAAPEALAAIATALGFVHVQTAETPAAALAAALDAPGEQPIIVTGSIYLLAEIYAALDNPPPRQPVTAHAR